MTVIPAKAGIYIGASNKTHCSLWITAFAITLAYRLRGKTDSLKML
jgi:hypothetical protein